MRARWRERWASRPAWAKWVIAVYLIGFADGTGAHIRDLVSDGLRAYGFAPLGVRVFFIGLVLLDPLAFVLVLLMRPAGAWLAGVVMAADLATNWYVNVSAAPAYRARFLPWSGLVLITVFGLFVLASCLPLAQCGEPAGATAARAPDRQRPGETEC